MEVKEIINMLRKAEGYISFNAEFANEIADILEELENISSKWTEIYESYRERLVKFRKENEDLKKQLAEKPEWISVEDRLPKSEFVLCTDGKYCFVNIIPDMEDVLEDGVTHWMPLPEPPKPKEPTFKEVFLKAFPQAVCPDVDCCTIFPKHFDANTCNYVCEDCWNQPYFEPKEEGGEE